jgi:isoleucyl-tRNA synthetase
MTKNYPETTSNPNFPEIEKKIQKFWSENKIFEKSVDSLPKNQNEFSFFDGPPFANGLPHYGHLLTSCVKDIFARYQTMQGRRAERVFGWDCHGLPAEMEVEKELNIHGQLAIQEYGLGKFNDACRSSVMKYTNDWEDYVNRLGRWVDFKNGYKTMDKNYMESVIWAFSELYKKGLVYEGHKVMPYSWAAETPLSNFETRLDNSYREKKSMAAVVAFELEDVPSFIYGGILDIDENNKTVEVRRREIEKVYILAWTTTPWTLPSNLALAVGKDVNYTVITGEKTAYIVSSSWATKSPNEIKLENPSFSSVLSEDLLGLRYKPLFPYFANDKRGGKTAFTIIEGDFVSDTDGTGVVHIAPGFGEDDQRVAEANGICLPDNGGIVCPVDEAGKFTNEIFDFDVENFSYPDDKKFAPEKAKKNKFSLKGLNVIYEGVKEGATDFGIVNERVAFYLKIKGNLISADKNFKHNYPHCWRTDTPLIYKAVPSWYVKVTAFKDRMVELNHENINWIPSHIRDGQFGKWLENAHDWAISRNRFWGSPIPVWKSTSPDSKKLYVFGSIKEMEDFFGVQVNDLHRPFIDELTKPDPENPKYIIKRVSEVLDCWFESGSMPFAELHYPFENKEKFEHRFPADFIVEYVAQTRGWFYTLMVLSTALFDKAPFKNCICHGVILDENSQKLSKRLRNYPDPKEVFEQYGADSMRWMMVSSPVMSGGELNISKDGSDIRDAVRLVLKPIWNAYHFFCLYANSDNIKAEIKFDSQNLMDRYILAKLKTAVLAIENSFNIYQTNTACKAVEDFFEVLNNWYIRRSRDRFWSGNADADKFSAYNTLYTCLVTICKAAAPLAPFTLEEVYKNLTGAESVHLERFPDVSAIQDDGKLTPIMDKVREICNAGLAVRNKENIKVRQPLQTISIYGNVNPDSFFELPLIIKDELNVKGYTFSNDIDSVARRKLKINFPVLGKRLPNKVKDVISANKANQWEQVGSSIKIAGEVLEKNEFELTLQALNPKGAAATSDNNILVVLDLNITEELKNEGIARDIVRLIQQARKEADLNITDRIDISVKAPEAFAYALKTNSNYISEQTLAKSLDLGNKSYTRFKNSYKLDELDVEISFDIAA